MADLYEDFAYAQITASIAAGAPNDVLDIPVDTIARLPSVAELAAGDFWMTIESDLSNDVYEIVLVRSYPDATTVRVLRGQEGAGAPAHPASVYLKGSITAAMMRRLGQYRRYVDLGNVITAGGSQLVASASYAIFMQATATGVAALPANLGVDYTVAAAMLGASALAVTLTPEHTVTAAMGGTSQVAAALSVVSGGGGGGTVTVPAATYGGFAYGGAPYGGGGSSTTPAPVAAGSSAAFGTAPYGT